MKTISVVLMWLLFICFTSDVKADCKKAPSYVKTASRGPWKTGDSIVDAPNSCLKYTCQENETWTGKTCGLLMCPSNYKYTPEDNSKPFPDCCSKCKEK